MAKKQYVIEYETYTGNDKVSKYIDGKLVDYDIMNYWETSGYCSRLESKGYVRAYDVDEAYKKMMDAKSEYDYAVEAYEEAKKNALIKN